jgi:tetratricopeptide (TPR) repeat protein
VNKGFFKHFYFGESPKQDEKLFEFPEKYRPFFEKFSRFNVKFRKFFGFYFLEKNSHGERDRQSGFRPAGRLSRPALQSVAVCSSDLLFGCCVWLLLSKIPGMASPKIASTPDPDSLPPRWQAALRWGAPALTLAAMAILAWSCLFNPKIHFLSPGPARWIVYPLPPEAEVYTGFELTGTFRRDFVLPETPVAASLSWRCFTNGEVLVNGMVVPASHSSFENWKTTSQSEIGPLLHQGTNEILVVVTNQLGPPALSLELKAGNFLLDSDESWEVSLSGSNWRAAQAASVVPPPGKGNELYSLETTTGALRRCWPWLCLAGAISFVGVALLQYYLGRAASFPKGILVMVAAAWLLLFLHNFPILPAAAGFDAPEHLAYVNYIQDHHRLPDVREGWEMFQPPLYYLICATLLGLGHYQAFEPSGMMLLRFLSLAIGAANLALIFAGLRLIFPGDWKKPLAGLVLAALLPAQICLLHYTTNETLSAMFVTGALCVGLHLLRARQPWRGWYVVLGIALGLALMSKASAVLAVPAILGALASKLILRRERTPQVWLGVVVAPLLICLLVGGWHYAKLWQDYGNPFIGNWDPRVAAPWWQYKGLQTPGCFFQFGEALVHPFYSGLHSFWDGFYSTLWGDGLLGGKVNLWSRPPWNYDWMTVGFVLALVPAALVLTGLMRALARCFRSASLSWLLLLGFGWIFAFAILDMSLKVPSYAQTKAFYGLPVLLPFCALGALGFECWAARGKVTRYVLGVALGIWLVNLYASFWIRPNTVQSELSSAIARMLYLKGDPSEAFANVLNHYPGNSQATIWLASLESKKHPEQAVKRLEDARKNDPDNPQIESFLARDLAACDRTDEGIVHAKHAVELAHEDEFALQTWCALALRRQNAAEVVAAGREALSVKPTDLAIHFDMGVGLMNLGQGAEAIRHFSAVLKAKPAWAAARFYLGRCLLGQPGKRAEGVAEMREGLRLDPGNAAWQTELQNALQNH